MTANYGQVKDFPLSTYYFNAKKAAAEQFANVILCNNNK